jgi:glycosyltransferase involved in cell wall biosynthesis
VTHEGEYPLVTVVIPTLNEEKWIGDCLNALENQVYPKDRLEILVVDNGSSDKTCEIVRSMGIKLLRELKKSPYIARNTGIRNSSSDWLAFIDARCIASADWLIELREAAMLTYTDFLSGLTLYQNVNDSLGNLLFGENHTPIILKSAVEKHHCVAGNNMFVRRRLFHELGLFSEIRSGSDIEFSRRVFAAGHKIHFAERAKVIRQCDLSNGEYLKRTFRIKYGQTMHSEKAGWRDFVRNFKNIPWRPGFRSVSSVQQAANNKCKFLQLWMYKWVERWAGFCGSQWALTMKLRAIDKNRPSFSK